MPYFPNRRDFVKSTAAVGGSLALGYAESLALEARRKPRHHVERIGFAGVGLRYQGSVDLHTAAAYGDIVAVCDVDRNVCDQAKASFGSRPFSCEDYGQLLERKDIDAIIIGTPDHWHVKIAADALRAGKHVYVEKPVSLTIDEGKFLRDVAADSKSVLQVGSWQRSDSRFRLAVELVRGGRIGKLRTVEVVLGKNKVGGPFQVRAVPKHLNWDKWQGQTPDTPYIEERCHYMFRWWLEYAGGQLTDWGAHHIDIAQWAIGSFPMTVQGNAKFPASPLGFNVPIDFDVTCRYANDVTMTVSDTGRNGILFTGDQGRLFVNRGSISGRPIEDLDAKPMSRADFKLYEFDNMSRPERAGKLDAIVNHMGNFVDCIEAGKTPISDLESQHRSATTCHLGNIALCLGRSLKWDAEQEKFVDDDGANSWLSREQRKGYEVN